VSNRTSAWKVPQRVAAAVLVAVAVAAFGVAPAFATPAPVVSVRVEGSSATLFDRSVSVGTSVMSDTSDAPHTESGNAMAAVDVAARLGAFPYEITDSSFGLYVSSIAGELPGSAPDYPGWLYRVNGVSLLVGADHATLKTGDSVLWYYGTYDASPTVAVFKSAVGVGTTATITAEQLDPNGVVSPLAGATVHVGSHVLTSDANGLVRLKMNAAGTFGVRVAKDGCIRSALSTLNVRYGASFTAFGASKSSIRAGTIVTLTGRLASSGTALAGRTVRLLIRRAGSSIWVASASAKTGSNGRFTIRVRPPKSTYFKVVFAGDSSHLSATSATKLVRVR
jgi:hypothetical protein